jgi:hypothetical protein
MIMWILEVSTLEQRPVTEAALPLSPSESMDSSSALEKMIKGLLNVKLV